MDRIYHHYEKWEDFINGMYRTVPIKDETDYVLASFDLLTKPDNLKKAMMRVIDEWPIASEFNLTNTTGNRKSWLGQAACCIECSSPEAATREAWNDLPEPLRLIANTIAAEVIQIFESRYAEKMA